MIESKLLIWEGLHSSPRTTSPDRPKGCDCGEAQQRLAANGYRQMPWELSVSKTLGRSEGAPYTPTKVYLFFFHVQKINKKRPRRQNRRHGRWRICTLPLTNIAWFLSILLRSAPWKFTSSMLKNPTKKTIFTYYIRNICYDTRKRSDICVTYGNELRIVLYS